MKLYKRVNSPTPKRMYSLLTQPYESLKFNEPPNDTIVGFLKFGFIKLHQQKPVDWHVAEFVQTLGSFLQPSWPMRKRSIKWRSTESTWESDKTTSLTKQKKNIRLTLVFKDIFRWALSCRFQMKLDNCNVLAIGMN